MTRPCRTAEPDVEIETLSFPEQFLVWSVRAWVDGYKAGTGRAALLREGFALAGVADGWLVIEELMSIVAATAKRPLDVRCLACRTLGEDEGPLLSAVAGLQQDSEVPAVVIVADWLPPSAARAALALLTRLAGELFQAGLRLPAPMRPSTSDRGLALVH